jgi:hypothetical protein
VQATPDKNLATLRASISSEWATIDEYYVRNACRPYRRRQRHVVAAVVG